MNSYTSIFVALAACFVCGAIAGRAQRIWTDRADKCPGAPPLRLLPLSRAIIRRELQYQLAKRGGDLVTDVVSLCQFSMRAAPSGDWEIDAWFDGRAATIRGTAFDLVLRVDEFSDRFLKPLAAELRGRRAAAELAEATA